MADYNSMKVPELKKLLQDRNLPVSGNKADLIARLQEDDQKPATAAAAVPASEPAPEATTAAAQPTTDAAPAAPTEATAAPAAPDAAAAAAAATEAPAAPAAPVKDYSMGMGETDAEKEAAKRAERAKRFGIVEDQEEKKLKERAERFGASTAPAVKGLDSALPERRPKRAREREAGRQQPAGRSAKRQTPDRRSGPATAAVKKALGILDDPAEKAKAEARAKRFAAA